MRLSKQQISTIKKLAHEHFGQDVTVFLFGSRTDEHKKGGDIDLFIKCKDINNESYLKKIKFQSDLEYSLGEQKIDVLLFSRLNHQSKFFQSIEKSAIAL